MTTLGGIVELTQALLSPSKETKTSSVRHEGAKKRRGGRPSTSTHGVKAEHLSVANGASGSLGWHGDEMRPLLRSLFDAIPELFAVTARDGCEVETAVILDRGIGYETTDNVVAAAEYGLWLTMDVLRNALQSGSRDMVQGGKPGLGKKGGAECYDEKQAGGDAENVLACIKTDPSPQTRRVSILFFYFCSSCRGKKS